MYSAWENTHFKQCFSSHSNALFLPRFLPPLVFSLAFYHSAQIILSHQWEAGKLCLFLSSTFWFQLPIIHPQYLSHGRDFEISKNAKTTFNLFISEWLKCLMGGKKGHNSLVLLHVWCKDANWCQCCCFYNLILTNPVVPQDKEAET